MHQILDIAQKLNPKLLTDSHLASEGAPIVGDDLIVESGNGRVIALDYVYRHIKKNAEKYKQYLVENAQKFGIKPEDINSVKKPILVRERISDVDRVKFVREANENAVSGMSAAENAKNDADLLTDDVLSLFETEKSIEHNRNFLTAFMRKLPQNERAALIRENGNISAEAIQRAKRALFAKAYGDADLDSMFSEYLQDENEIKNVTNALATAAPTIAVLENNGYHRELSVKENIADAAKFIQRTKKENVFTIDEALTQLNLFSEDDLTQEGRIFVKVFDKFRRSGRKIGDFLIDYAKRAIAKGKPDNGSEIYFPGFEREKITQNTKRILLKRAIQSIDGQDSEIAKEIKTTPIETQKIETKEQPNTKSDVHTRIKNMIESLNSPEYDSNTAEHVSSIITKISGKPLALAMGM